MILLALGVAALLAVMRPQAARAATFETLYSFCAVTTSAANCADGSAPSVNGRLAIDGAGNLYGTTGTGGTALNNGSFVLCGDQAAGCGTIYRLSPPPSGQGRWRETVLYSFCAVPNCPDGAYPGGVVIDASGNLFGTTAEGGYTFWEAGSVFELAAGGGLTTLYGSNNLSVGMFYPPTLAAGGVLYVATQGDGTYNAGNVFTLVPPQLGTDWTLGPAFGDFCVVFPPQAGCVTANPDSSVLIGPSGGVFGVTEWNGGAVYELAPGAAPREVGEFAFCSSGYPGCGARARLGENPRGGLVADAAGNLYGVTQVGESPGGGSVFELSPVAGAAGWQARLLYTFCQQANCDDGANPYGALAIDSDGTLYGTTIAGGGAASGNCGFVEGIQSGCGTVFKLTRPANGSTRWTHTVLHRFCTQPGCLDGAYPYPGLAIDAKRNLFGVTTQGGAHGQGTVFAIAP